jgi:hypothetical protein
MNPEAPSTLPMMAVLEEPSAIPLRRRFTAATAVVRPYLKTLASPLLEVSRAASSIFLCGSWQAGALLCASLLLVPRYFFFAISATLFGGVIAKLMHLPAAMRKDGTLLYNVLPQCPRRRMDHAEHHAAACGHLRHARHRHGLLAAALSGTVALVSAQGWPATAQRRLSSWCLARC